MAENSQSTNANKTGQSQQQDGSKEGSQQHTQQTPKTDCDMPQQKQQGEGKD